MFLKRWFGKFLSLFMGNRKRVRGRCIIKIEDHIEEWYMLWSVSNGTPLSRGLYKSEFENWHLRMFPKISSQQLDEILDEVRHRGTDHPDFDSCEDVIYYNKAGLRGEYVDKETLIRLYCEKPYVPRIEQNKTKYSDPEWKVYMQGYDTKRS
jgi:hypothetical protein